MCTLAGHLFSSCACFGGICPASGRKNFSLIFSHLNWHLFVFSSEPQSVDWAVFVGFYVTWGYRVWVLRVVSQLTLTEFRQDSQPHSNVFPSCGLSVIFSTQQNPDNGPSCNVVDVLDFPFSLQSYMVTFSTHFLQVEEHICEHFPYLSLCRSRWKGENVLVSNLCLESEHNASEDLWHTESQAWESAQGRRETAKQELQVVTSERGMSKS